MKTALVTGANRGIGRAFVENLESQGYKVYAGMRDIQKSNFKSSSIIPLFLDVTDDTSIMNAAKVLSNDDNVLNLIINNAGVDKQAATDAHPERVSDLASLDRKAMLHMFDVNSIGPILIAKHFLRFMTELGGFIVNISSCRASFHDEIKEPAGSYGYTASKIALNMLTKCLVSDLPDHISTFAVHPGLVKSDMVPRGNVEPKEAVEAILKIISKWDPKNNGAFLRFDGTRYPL